MESLQYNLDEAVREISTNHRRILDDWCKAYMAELYELGLEIKPGCFTLNQMQMNDGGLIGWKYWFTFKGKTMDEHMIIETTIKDMFDNACNLIMNENLDDAEFELCKNTIQTTLTYLNSKRKKEN